MGFSTEDKSYERLKVSQSNCTSYLFGEGEASPPHTTGSRRNIVSEHLCRQAVNLFVLTWMSLNFGRLNTESCTNQDPRKYTFRHVHAQGSLILVGMEVQAREFRLYNPVNGGFWEAKFKPRTMSTLTFQRIIVLFNCCWSAVVSVA